MFLHFEVLVLDCVLDLVRVVGFVHHQHIAAQQNAFWILISSFSYAFGGFVVDMVDMHYLEDIQDIEDIDSPLKVVHKDTYFGEDIVDTDILIVAVVGMDTYFEVDIEGIDILVGKNIDIDNLDKLAVAVGVDSLAWGLVVVEQDMHNSIDIADLSVLVVAFVVSAVDIEVVAAESMDSEEVVADYTDIEEAVAEDVRIEVEFVAVVVAAVDIEGEFVVFEIVDLN